MIYSAKQRMTRILFPTLFTGDMTVHGVEPPQQPLCRVFVDLRVFQDGHTLLHQKNTFKCLTSKAKH